MKMPIINNYAHYNWYSWPSWSEALFDICIVDIDIQSYLYQAPDLVRSKSTYFAPATAHCALFTPLCFQSMAVHNTAAV